MCHAGITGRARGRGARVPPVVPHGCWRGGAKDAGMKVLWVTPNGCWGHLPSPKHTQEKGEAMGRTGQPHTSTPSPPTPFPQLCPGHSHPMGSAPPTGVVSRIFRAPMGAGGGSEGVRGWVSPLGTTCPQAFPHSRFVPSVGSLKIWASSSHLASRAQGAMNAVGSGRICGLSVLLL